MDLMEFIKSLIQSGKSKSEVVSEVINKGTYDATPDDISDAYIKASAAVEAEKAIDKAEADRVAKQKEEEKIKQITDRVEKDLQAKFDEKLKEIEAKSKLGGGDRNTKFGANDDNWKQKQAEVLHLHVREKLLGYSSLKSEQCDRFTDLKNEVRQNKAAAMKARGYDQKTVDGQIAGTDSAGGSLIFDQYDQEVDKLAARDSEIIEHMKIRKGDEKTIIQSIDNWSLVDRANENAAFTESKVATYEQEIQFKDAGTVIHVSKRLIDAPSVDIVEQLIDSGKNAKIKFIEPMICTNNTGDGDNFSGMRFHTGVQTVNCENIGVGGAPTYEDLRRLYNTCPSDSRDEPGGYFICDSRERSYLYDLTASDDHFKKGIKLTDDGKYIHRSAGKQIITVNNLPRTLDGVSSKTGGTDVFMAYVVLPRFRYYEKSGLEIDMSSEVAFKEKQIALLFSLTYMLAIPTNSRTSFVNLLGVKSQV